MQMQPSFECANLRYYVKFKNSKSAIRPISFFLTSRRDQLSVNRRWAQSRISGRLPD